jgi:hypothetical protein
MVMPIYYKGPRPRSIAELVAAGVLVPIDPPRTHASIRCELLDHLASIHEAAHTTWAYFNRQPIHDVRINGEGFGGGEFRHSERSTVELSDGSDSKQRAREDLMTGALLDEGTRRVWLHGLVLFAVSKSAQRRFGARDPFYDAACEDDDRVIDRVIGVMTKSPERARRYREQVDREAEEFVATHWREIRRLGDQLLIRKHLDADEIDATIRSVRRNGDKLFYRYDGYIRAR